MAKYLPLAEFAATFTEVRTLDLDEVESFFGFALPESARKYPALWAHQDVAADLKERRWRVRPQLAAARIRVVQCTSPVALPAKVHPFLVEPIVEPSDAGQGMLR